MVDGIGLTMVQLHGDEGPAFCEEVARRTGAKVIKAAAVRGKRRHPRRCEPSTPTSTCSTPTAPGCAAARARPSTGSWCARGARRIPLILSGGLTPENVAEAIAAVRPFAVDTASGTEAAPGSRTPRSSTPSSQPAVQASTALRPRSAGVEHRVSPAVEHRFGPYGGQYVPETLMPALAELEAAWLAARDDAGFRAELDGLLRDFVGRPSPLYLADRLSEVAGRRMYLKREDLNHTGAHKINNALGQALLARRMGKRRIIAETGAGQHGVATATACALLGLECVVYMGEEDIRRQAPNVQRMELLGATVVAGRRRRAHAQGGDVGGDPRLGHERRHARTTSSARPSARRPIRRSCATCSA